MNKNILIIILVMIIMGMFFSGSSLVYAKKADRDFENTPAWELSKAIQKENVKRIKKILNESPELLNFQEPEGGRSLLFWAVGLDRYKSVKALLECGADPDIATTKENSTPLMLASGYLWRDRFANKDPKYVKLLLKYGADPNIAEFADKESATEEGHTPLMYSIGCGIEKTKALVEAGADINAKTIPSGRTAANCALCNYNPTEAFMEYAYYLIVEKKAKVNEVYYRNGSHDDPYNHLYPVYHLRHWVFDLDSKFYQIKMEIVKEFARQGVDYWSVPIPEAAMKKIKRLHPNDWEEYIKKY